MPPSASRESTIEHQPKCFQEKRPRTWPINDDFTSQLSLHKKSLMLHSIYCGSTAIPIIMPVLCCSTPIARHFMRAVQSLSMFPVRAYASTTIPLAYTLHEPPKGTVTTGPPMVVMHGLFGSKQNNHSISK